MKSLTPIFETRLGRLYRGNCMSLLPRFPYHIVDLVCVDLPYQNTDNDWDVILPYEKLWEIYRCICKERAPIVLNGAEPFASELRMSNRKWYRHDFYWDKVVPGGIQLCKTQPPRRCEPIMVFGSGVPRTYNPQKTPLDKPVKHWAHTWTSSNYERSSRRNPVLREYTHKHPTNLVQRENKRGVSKHPTAKPVELAEFFIKTYSNKGDLVLDHCAGGGTTLVAAEKLERQWIGIEQSAEYCAWIIERFRTTF